MPSSRWSGRREADALHDLRRRARVQARQGAAPAPEGGDAGALSRRCSPAGRSVTSRARPGARVDARGRPGVRRGRRSGSADAQRGRTVARGRSTQPPAAQAPTSDPDAGRRAARRRRGPGASPADSRVAAAARRAAAPDASGDRLHHPPAGRHRQNRFRPRHGGGGHQPGIQRRAAIGRAHAGRRPASGPPGTAAGRPGRSPRSGTAAAGRKRAR